MKNNFLAFILLLLPFFSFSQTQITVGKPYQVVDAKDKFYFHQGEEILTVKIHGDEIILQKFDAGSLNIQNTKTYEDMPKKWSWENILEFNNRYYLFYSLWDPATEHEQLFEREIDFKQCAFIGKGNLLLKVNGKISGSLAGSGFYNFEITDKFHFFSSFDNSKMLIQYRLKPEVKNDDKSYDIIGLNVFDKELQNIYKSEVKMPYTEKKMNNLDYSIDSEGNIYILSTVYDDNTTEIKKGKDAKANYHIELLRIKANSTDIVKTQVIVGNKFINKIWLYESPNNYMICAGFYNNGRDLNNANGIMIFKIGKEGDAFDLATYEIPVKILNQYVTERSQNKNKKDEEKDKAEFEDLELREFIVQKDGSILLIGEQHYIRVHTSYTSSAYGGGSTTTYYTYHYNDLLVTKISPDGNLDWMKKLPKRQVGTRGQGGMSYKLLRGEDNYYLLFLDNVKNMTLPMNKLPNTHNDGVGGFLTAYKLNNSDGEVSKISILDTKNVNKMEIYQFLTSRILPIDDKEFIFEVYKKKKEDVLIKVQFK